MKIKDVIIDMHQGINTVADKVEYLDSGIPIIQSKNFTKGYLDLEDVRYLGKKDEKKYIEKYNPQVGDILIANIGTIGKSYVVSEKRRFLIAWNVFLIKPNAEKIKTEFLKFYFDYLMSINYFDTLLTGGTVKFINKKKIGNIIVPDRTIVEQKEICERLSKVEKILIEKQEQLKLLDNLIQSRFVEMFGDPITNSKLLPIEKIEERYFLKAGITTKAEDIHDYLKDKYEIPCYGGNGIRGYVENLSYEGCYPIIGRQGALCGNVQYATGKFHATEHAVLVSTLKNDNTMWVYYMLKLMDLYRYHTGAAQPGLAVKKLNTIDVIVADINLQNQFAAFVHQINKSKFVIHKFLYCTTHNTKSIIKPRPNTKESGKIRGGKPHADEF